MVGKVRIVYRLAAVVSGLCLFLSGCATPTGSQRVVEPAGSVARQAPASDASRRIAPNDPPTLPDAVGVQILPIPAPIQSPAPQAQVRARIALLLPLQSESLAAAAAVVRAGFMAAAEREADRTLSIEVIDSGEAPQDILASYSSAAQSFDILVGPLSRSGVSAVAQSGAVAKPTIALSQIEVQDEARPSLPRKMVSIGLSIEDEARQVAGWLHARKPAGLGIVLATSTAWQRRAAKAFADRWKQLGYEVEMMELDVSAQGTYLGANGLIGLQKRLQVEKPPFLFSALDGVQTSQLRMLIGTDIPVYGTSQLNPTPMAQLTNAEAQPEMNGVRLVDMPWQLQADHPAVMTYAQSTQLAAPAEPQRSADLERLYALGIDAFRVAREIALRQTQFQIDGVTGKLRIDLDKEMARFERIQTRAVYREGRVVPVSGAQ